MGKEMMDTTLMSIVIVPTLGAYVYLYIKVMFHMSELGRKNIFFLFIRPCMLKREHFDETGWKYYKWSYYIILSILIFSLLLCVLIKKFLFAA